MVPLVDDPVFSALADPTRRRLLDSLFERDGRMLAELVEAVPEMTRFGVMKHLRVLEGADLVTTRRVGREKHHYLNPVPIRRLHDRWLDKYRSRSADLLLDVARSAELLEEPAMTATTAPAFVSAIYIRAAPETVWRAITESDFTRRYYYGSTIDTDWRPGSPYTMTIEGEVHIEGEIVEADPPRRLVQTFHAIWDEAVRAEPATRVTWEIEPAMPGVTKLTLVHEQLETAPATREQVSSGWTLILSGLKTLLETGESMGAR